VEYKPQNYFEVFYKKLRRPQINAMLNLKNLIMIDLLIKNELGTSPLATARSNDPVGAHDLRVTNLDPAVRIAIGTEYMVGLDDGTNTVPRTCTAKAGTNATFTR
jgi:hypothetical protein